MQMIMQLRGCYGIRKTISTTALLAGLVCVAGVAQAQPDPVIRYTLDGTDPAALTNLGTAGAVANATRFSTSTAAFVSDNRAGIGVGPGNVLLANTGAISEDDPNYIAGDLTGVFNSTSYTFMSWVKYGGFDTIDPAGLNYLSANIGMGGPDQWIIVAVTTDRFQSPEAEHRVGFYNNGAWRNSSINTPDMDVWTHLTWVFNATTQTATIYKNAGRPDEEVDSTLPYAPRNLNGNWSSDNGGGLISRLKEFGLYDFRIYNAALTQQEVSAIVGTPAHAGDFDGDGDVDGADFVAWQTNFPKATDATLAEGDADGDGDVDGADFVVWQTNFPFTPGQGVAPVPEPQAVALAVIGVAMLVGTRKSRSRQMNQR